MKTTSCLLILVFLLWVAVAMGQSQSTQTIRGQVLDEVTHNPIKAATIQLVGATPPLLVSTDSGGNFRMGNVPVGQQSINISFTGYEPQLINELLVTSGKEIVLNILLSEKINTLTDVKVTAATKRVTNNDMVTVSGRSFNVDDTRRYAGSLGDPSRMVANFAGVSSANDSRNDIIVRGNSPAGVLWQLEGIDIPNPNHYGSLTSTGGPVTMLNINNLSKSDFLTGAFPAQYGNALSSVFDLRLRNGNNARTELLGQMSFNGFEFGAEGPFFKKGGSYIINYRYATLGLIKSLGFNIGTGGAVPQFQDVNFKVAIPLSAKNKFAFFGLIGPSNVNFIGNKIDTSRNALAYGNENINLFTRYTKIIVGGTLETNFSNKTFGKLSIGYGRATENIDRDSISLISRLAYRELESRYATNTANLVYKLLHKFSAKNNLTAGIINNFYFFNIFNRKLINGGQYQRINLDQRGSTFLSQAYAELKHRFSDKLYINAGFHAQVLALNGAFAAEPRLGLKYKMTSRSSLSLGYGTYSQMQNLVVYFNQTVDAGGAVQLTNKNLGFTKSHQVVAGYDYNISKDVYFKTEVYYQALTNVPVETRSSGYSVLNSGSDFGADRKNYLVNNGTGTNYGAEFTLEKYYSRGTYFLFTTSLFNSKYRGSDGVQRNTAFNSRYVVNLLAGKDLLLNRKKMDVLNLNLKLSTVGGKFTSPVNVAASIAENATRYDEIIAPFSLRQKAYFRADFKIGYRANRRRSTLEYGIDIQNITASKNVASQSYNRRTDKVELQYQQGLLPIPYFRYTF